jgi:hypothetical protein
MFFRKAVKIYTGLHGATVIAVKTVYPTIVILNFCTKCIEVELLSFRCRLDLDLRSVCRD